MADTTLPTLPTLPGQFGRSGCRACLPELYSTAGGRLHEGHFSVDLGDHMATVRINGDLAIGVREVLIDPATHLAIVWVYPKPVRRCDCGAAEARLEVWYDVPGVGVQITHTVRGVKP